MILESHIELTLLARILLTDFGAFLLYALLTFLYRDFGCFTLGAVVVAFCCSLVEKVEAHVFECLNSVL
jgi:hypothetical protein